MVKKLLTPIQKFVRIESLSGMLLFGATLLALILANSPLADRFQSIWQYKMGISTSGFELIKPLILWINDGLMAIFFFLIGLEIKRELLIGELNSVKKASFPLFAAIGGMLLPVLFFLLLNKNPDNAHAWFLLGHIVDSKDRQIRYLQKAVELDPENPVAKTQVAKLITPAVPVPVIAQEEAGGTK